MKHDLCSLEKTFNWPPNGPRPGRGFYMSFWAGGSKEEMVSMIKVM